MGEKKRKQQAKAHKNEERRRYINAREAVDKSSAKQTIRNLPVILDAKLRMPLEAITIGFDVIELQMADVIDVCLRVANSMPNIKIDSFDRVRLFNSIWSIVDQLHNISNFLRTFPEFDDQIRRDFDGFAAIARRMRNKMDHLPGNIANIANKKDPWPLYGALSFHHHKDSDIIKSGEIWYSEGVDIVFITASAHHGAATFPADKMVAPTIFHKIGNFTFFAFDEILNIQSAHRCCAEMFGLLSKRLEDDWNRARSFNGELWGRDVSATVPSPGVAVIRMSYKKVSD